MFVALRMLKWSSKKLLCNIKPWAGCVLSAARGYNFEKM